MLHDLYLLSCYFDAPSAILYEDDLKRRYAPHEILHAMKEGWLDFYRAPCLRGDAKCFYRLSQKGLRAAELQSA